MKSKAKKYISLSSLTVFIIFLGFYRDFVFKNINALLKALNFEIDYTMPASLAFMQKWDYSSIISFKWFLTLLFTVLFLGISILFIKNIFSNKKYITYTFWSFVAVTGISLIIIALGFVFKNKYNDFYSVSRYLMGIVQSPILLMILIPAFKISDIQLKENQKRNS